MTSVLASRIPPRTPHSRDGRNCRADALAKGEEVRVKEIFAVDRTPSADLKHRAPRKKIATELHLALRYKVCGALSHSVVTSVKGTNPAASIS